MISVLHIKNKILYLIFSHGKFLANHNDHLQKNSYFGETIEHIKKSGKYNLKLIILALMSFRLVYWNSQYYVLKNTWEMTVLDLCYITRNQNYPYIKIRNIRFNYLNMYMQYEYLCIIKDIQNNIHNDYIWRQLLISVSLFYVIWLIWFSFDLY